MKRKYPFITIILPIRNEKHNIRTVLNSIINQKYPEKKLEIIIADGSSNDGTCKIIKDFQKTYSNIKIINNNKKNVSTGFNLALNQSVGEYIFRIDGHCEIYPYYFRQCIELFNKVEADIVGGKIETISRGKIGEAIAIAQSSYFGVGSVKFRNSNDKQSFYVDTLAFGAHKRELFSSIGGYDEEMICNQDDEFNFRAIQAGKKIWMDTTIKTKYFCRSNYIQLFKQYCSYGYYKVRGIQKRRQVISVRHLVPVSFVIGLMGTLILGNIFEQPFIAYSILLTYIIINFSFSIISATSIIIIPLISFSYCILHLGYGLGFIWGLFRFKGKWRDRSLRDYHYNRKLFISNTSVPLTN